MPASAGPVLDLEIASGVLGDRTPRVPAYSTENAASIKLRRDGTAASAAPLRSRIDAPSNASTACTINNLSF